MFLESYGAIHAFDLQPEYQQKIVDNSHLVAWSGPCATNWRWAIGFIAAFTSGEKIVCRFFGPTGCWFRPSSAGSSVGRFSFLPG